MPTILYRWADGLALSLGGARRFQDLSLACFQGIADALQRPRDEVLRWARDDAARVRACWASDGVREAFSKRQRDPVERHFERVRALWGPTSP